MNTLGLDLSCNTCGWAISSDKKIVECGFFDLSKSNNFKQKSDIIISGLKNKNFQKINVEETLLGFRFGGSSQQTIVKLIKNKSVVCYILEEEWKIPINFINVNTARKLVLGKARTKGLKSKEFVKLELPRIVPYIHKFNILNKKGNVDKRMEDAWDAIICSLFG